MLIEPYLEHLVPDGERHGLTAACDCEPFAYVRIRNGAELGIEYRHNSFAALPVHDPHERGSNDPLEEVETNAVLDRLQGL